MSIKDILVCLDPTDAGDVRLRLATALAIEHRARLSAICVLPELIPGAPPAGHAGVMSPPTGLAWLPQDLPTPRDAPPTTRDMAAGPELAAIIEQRFREEAQPHGIEGDWQLLSAGDEANLMALAGTTDLIVCGQTSPAYRLPSGYRPENIIVGGGRPVLVIPYAGEFATIGCRVLVAWDGTREAVRALHDALLLIAKAEAVTVVTVRSREGSFAQDTPALHRVVRHLKQHGIAAQYEEALRGDLSVVEVLLSRTTDLDADLIVAGAYHHSQFREALVGGVSRDLLDHMTVPVLMSH